MFQLLLDSHHNVLMTRLHGTYVEDDITLRDRAVARFIARHGPARGILDFTGVDTVAVSVDVVVRRAQALPLPPDQTQVIVAPCDPAWGLGRIIVAHQSYSRGLEPLLVRTLDEAYRALAIGDPKFEPLEGAEATELDGVAWGVLARIDASRAKASSNQRRRMRAKMLRLLDTVLAKEQAPMPSTGAITLGDVLNAALCRNTVRDADLAATCSHCHRKTSLDVCRIEAGRETTYWCPACGGEIVALRPAASASQEAETPPGYLLGTFIVRAAVDIECPGALLPKS